MTWTVVNETGAGPATLSAAGEKQLLHSPAFAVQADDGTYLIVDELGREKQVPFSFGCRTIRVDADGSILYDSQTSGIDDGYGCLLDDGFMAILRRTKWELLIISPDGVIADVLYLDTFSKRLPRYVSWTCNGTFLVVFDNRAYDLDIVEIDLQGRLLWCLPSHVRHVGLPASAQLTRSDTILIADPIRHVAMEIDRAGNVVWQFGETKHPSSSLDHLSNPCSIRRLHDGRHVVADTRNHRVMLIDVDGTGREVMPNNGTLRDPAYADVLDNGNYLICDTGNARIIELDQQGDIVWYYGASTVSRRLLSFPRSVEVTASGGYLVADTAHDRIIEILDGRVSEIPFLDEPGLFWPRCVRMLPSGSLLIADARNSRIVEVSAEGFVLRALTHIDLGSTEALQDPHDVRLLPDDRLLITDSHQDLVVVVDWSGRVHQVVGRNGSIVLDDPHSAQQLDDGSIAIADTGNHRIVVVDLHGAVVSEISTVYDDLSRLRLNRPRYVEVIPDGTMVIADTGNNRILAATITGRLIWEFSRVPDSPLSRLSQPRWVKLLNRNEVVICDHFHHRILHVRNDLS
ncbi:MAG: NHL repeat-containing protein [Gammaproteobacteria bacterium]